jgi:hypothetical protein
MNTHIEKPRFLAGVNPLINKRNGESAACRVHLNGEGPPKKESFFVKASSAAKRVAKEFRRITKASRPALPPTPKDLATIESKVLAGEKLSEDDIGAVMAILKQFSKSARIVRTLAKTDQRSAVLATQYLVNTSIENVLCLEMMPAEKLHYFAAGRTSFPMLVPVRGATKKINKQINEIGLGSETLPGVSASARSKQDKAAAIAEELILELLDGRPADDFSLKNFNALWKEARLKLNDYLRQNPSVLIEMENEGVSRSDKSPGRRKARVIENVRLRMRAKLGLKAFREMANVQK